MHRLRPHRHKSNLQILTSLFVFKSCQFKPLVENAPKLIFFSKKLGLDFLANLAIKKTFFSHFCGFLLLFLGGESISDVLLTISRLKSSKMKPILDLALESELDSKDSSKAFSDSALKDLVQTMKDSIDVSSDSFIALKTTAFIPPIILLRASNTLHFIKDSSRSLFNIDHSLLNIPDSELYLNLHDFACLKKGFSHIEDIIDYAASNNTKVMIDAEQSYIQPSIDDISTTLSRKFNKSKPIVFHTIQLYLKDGIHKLKSLLQENFKIGVKIVRGAYMHSEREYAIAKNIACPVFNTKQETDESYNAAIRILVSSDVNPHVIVASHNSESAHLAASLLDGSRNASKSGGDSSNCRIEFAQLLGMQDLLGAELVEKGFVVYKYVPWGPLEVTIPYLMRRAQENSDVLGNVGTDVDVLWEELKNRKLVR